MLVKSVWAIVYIHVLGVIVYLRKMNDKQIFERNVFERFIKIYRDLPSGTVFKSESPDFLIKSAGETIGIEITKIVNEKNPGEKFSPVERNSLEQKISKEAENVFKNRHNIPLHVNFAFHDSINVNGDKIKALGVQLASLVAKEISSRPLSEYYHLDIERGLPKELMHMSIAYFPNVTQSIWYSAKGQFLPNLKKEQILKVIKNKESKIQEYKRKADYLILLLVEGVIPESWFDGVETIEQTELKSEFDRILIFRSLDNVIVKLK
jgi:hypothetical protein